MKKLFALIPVFACVVVCNAETFLFPRLPSFDGRGGRILSFNQAGPYQAGFVRAADAEEIICDNGTNRTRRAGASWFLKVDQKVCEAFAVTAESRAETEVLGTENDYSLYLDITYQDGGHLWGQKAAFSPDPRNGWQTRTVFVIPERPVKSIIVYLLHREGSGRVRFRSPSFESASGMNAVFFDQTPVVASPHLNAACFLIRDAAADSGFARIENSALGLSLAVETSDGPVGRIFDVTLSTTSACDRAVTLVYTVPLPDGDDFTWCEGPRTDKKLSAGSGERGFFAAAACGRGMHSRWPFGAVRTGHRGLALGIDPDAPAFFRVACNPSLRQLYIAFDIGLAPEKLSAHFKFCSLPFTVPDADAPEGTSFRLALEAYRKQYPEAFRVRIKRQGVWIPFHAISTVRGWQDFGFRFKEGNDETAWDDAHDVLTFRYTEPCTFWMPVKKDGYTLADGVAAARALAQKGHPDGKAWASSVFHDERGKAVGRCLDTPWCKGVVWSVNSAPGLTGPLTDWMRKNGEPAFSNRYTADPPKGLDGEYIDSAEMYVTAVLDFNRAHFSSMKRPLCFSSDRFKVGIFKGMIAYEYVRALSENVHAGGRFMMANATPASWPWLAPWLDVMGTETNWNRKKGASQVWSPLSDGALMYRRALCGGKPFCFLMNTDFSTFTYACSEKFMRRSLAYGLFPGYFSADASSGHYFSRPELYERDRPLFKKYVPLVKKVAEAGWQPVNRLLVSSDPQVITEQFGTCDGARYATVFNLSDKPRTVRLRRLASGTYDTPELVTDTRWHWKDGACEVTLSSEQVCVLVF